jgi:fluoroquinolone transport system ATP-binding protein
MGDVEELCDEVAFIANGRLLETASPKSLKLKYGKRALKVEYLEGDEMKNQEFPMDGLNQQTAFQALLQHHKIITMHSQETSLDQIFIQITGKK